MNSSCSTALAVLCLTLPSFAQSSLVLPREYERAWGRGSSSALGGNSTRTQVVFANPFPSGTTVLGFGLRGTGATTDKAAFQADIEIQVSSTTAVPGSLDTTFANNIGNDVVTVLPQQMVTIPAMLANRPTSDFARITFQTPFVFGMNGASNILVDLFVYGRSAGASWSTDRAFASGNGRATTVGTGCGSATVSSTSAGGTYVAGATMTVTLAGAPPMTPAILFPSVDMSELLPGFPLPWSLTALGAGVGCDVLVNATLPSVPLTTDVGGGASVAFPIPFSVARVGTGSQWLYLDAPTVANPLGLFTTANRAVWIGPEVVVPDAQYVWDLSNVNATTGNATTDSVPVVEFITM
ncbi:MAG: hypothetical protein H6834_12390 [Planctomycetes bacterium]|nr:hypothetical protein [Planctomycetota bacterium]